MWLKAMSPSNSVNNTSLYSGLIGLDDDLRETSAFREPARRQYRAISRKDAKSHRIAILRLS